MINLFGNGMAFWLEERRRYRCAFVLLLHEMLFVMPEIFIIIDTLPAACSFLVILTIKSLRQFLLLPLCL
jgi:hypothetical protein